MAGLKKRALVIFVIVAVELAAIFLASPQRILSPQAPNVELSSSPSPPENYELPASFRAGTFFLDTNGDASSDITLPIAQNGDVPLLADWDGDGVETAGFYRHAEEALYVRSANTPKAPEFIFSIANVSLPANSTVTPIVGDWDGDGSANFGVYLSTSESPHGLFLLFYDSVFAGSPNGTPVPISISGGTESDLPIVGDWNGDGIYSIGTYRPRLGYFYLRNANSTGRAQIKFHVKTDRLPKYYQPISGDWSGTGSEQVGLYDGARSTYLLYNSFLTDSAPTTKVRLTSDFPLTGRVKYSDPHACGAHCVDLLVDSVPNGASISLDTVDQGITPLRVQHVIPKRYSVAFALGRYSPLLLSVDVPSNVTEFAINPIPVLNPISSSWICGTGIMSVDEQPSILSGPHACLVNPFGHCGNDPRVRRAIKRINDAGGSVPGIQCEQCAQDFSAAYNCDNNTIVACDSAGPVIPCSLYAHELTHAAQYWEDPSSCHGDCFGLACHEVEAVAMSGKCCGENGIDLQCVRNFAYASIIEHDECKDRIEEYLNAAMERCVPDNPCSSCPTQNPPPECIECPTEVLPGGSCKYCPPLSGNQCDWFCPCEPTDQVFCSTKGTCFPRDGACDNVPPGHCSDNCGCPAPLYCDSGVCVDPTPNCTPSECAEKCAQLGLVCDANNYTLCACVPNIPCPKPCEPGESCEPTSGRCEPNCESPPCTCDPSCGPLPCDQQTGRCKPKCDKPPCDCNPPCANGLICNKTLGVCEPSPTCLSATALCCGTTCVDPNQVCDPTDGQCKDCAKRCDSPTGSTCCGANERCVDGSCQPCNCDDRWQDCVTLANGQPYCNWVRCNPDTMETCNNGACCLSATTCCTSNGTCAYNGSPRCVH